MDSAVSEDPSGTQGLARNIAGLAKGGERAHCYASRRRGGSAVGSREAGAVLVVRVVLVALSSVGCLAAGDGRRANGRSGSGSASGRQPGRRPQCDTKLTARGCLPTGRIRPLRDIHGADCGAPLETLFPAIWVRSGRRVAGILTNPRELLDRLLNGESGHRRRLMRGGWNRASGVIRWSIYGVCSAAETRLMALRRPALAQRSCECRQSARLGPSPHGQGDARRAFPPP